MTFNDGLERLARNNSLIVRFRSLQFAVEDDIAPGIAKISDLLRQRHRQVGDEEDDFSIRNLTEIANTASASANTVSMLLAAVAAVSLLVGGIG